MRPIERESLRQKFDGNCAYCGQPLGKSWHADHHEPLYRRWRKDGSTRHPERDSIDNMFPSCIPCNISKGVFSIEEWREKLLYHVQALRKNHSTYRLALAYGLVKETDAPVRFYFEERRE